MYKYLLPTSAVLSAAFLVLPLQVAQAGTGSANGTLNVGMTIDNFCAIETPTTALNFGNRQIMDANVDAAATLRVKCVAGTKFAVSLGQGNNTSRRMRLGATTNYIDYELYTDNARTVAWPTAAPAAADYPLTGTGLSQDVVIYGRAMQQAQVPAAGAYTDAVVVTVSY